MKTLLLSLFLTGAVLSAQVTPVATTVEVDVQIGVTTLQTAMLNTDTAMTVVDASQFTDAVPFNAFVESEVVRVTAVSGTTFTVTRGTQGTKSPPHAQGVVAGRYAQRIWPVASIAALNGWTATQTVGNPPLPKYASIDAVIHAFLRDALARPVVQAKPPAAVAAAQAAADAAAVSLKTAQDAALPQ